MVMQFKLMELLHHYHRILIDYYRTHDQFNYCMDHGNSTLSVNKDLDTMREMLISVEGSGGNGDIGVVLCLNREYSQSEIDNFDLGSMRRFISGLNALSEENYHPQVKYCLERFKLVLTSKFKNDLDVRLQVDHALFTKPSDVIVVGLRDNNQVLLRFLMPEDVFHHVFLKGASSG
jgi:hypothetical protein